MAEPRKPSDRFENIGQEPYDALITPDGRYYIAGLFGEDGMALLDLWHPERGVRRILDGYAARKSYPSTRCRTWKAGPWPDALPSCRRSASTRCWSSTPTTGSSGRIAVHGQPVFVMARPDGRQVWVNFAHPDNDTVQVIDVQSQASSGH